MKKILKSSVLFFGFCFFAGKVNAQLASETPAMTPEQFSKLIKEKTIATPVVVPISADSSKTKIKTVVSKERPVLSDQDAVKPVLPSEATKPASAEATPVKIAEVKLPVAPVQDQKAKTKD